MTMTSKQLPVEVKAITQEVRKWLVRGDVKRIAEEVGFTPEYTSLVLCGKEYNEKVIDAAFTLALDRKIKHINQTNRIKQLE